MQVIKKTLTQPTVYITNPDVVQPISPRMKLFENKKQTAFRSLIKVKWYGMALVVFIPTGIVIGYGDW